jgi:hypothetical protein
LSRSWIFSPVNVSNPAALQRTDETDTYDDCGHADFLFDPLAQLR